MGGLAIGDKNKRKKQSRCVQSVYILPERNSDTSLLRTDRLALIPTPTRIVPLPPQTQTQTQTQALAKAVVVVVVVVVAHVQEGQNAVGADPSPATPTHPVLIHAPVQCRVQAQNRVPLHEDSTPPVHSRGLWGRNASAHRL